MPPALRASQLLATPIPSAYESQGLEIQRAVEQAVQESVQLGVDKQGKQVTPWLLKRVGELTKGKALESSKSYLPISGMLLWMVTSEVKREPLWADIALIENNAAVGAQIGQGLLKLKRDHKEGSANKLVSQWSLNGGKNVSNSL